MAEAAIKYDVDSLEKKVNDGEKATLEERQFLVNEEERFRKLKEMAEKGLYKIGFITDGTRDSHQSNEATLMPLELALEVLAYSDMAGYDAIEFGGAQPQMAVKHNKESWFDFLVEAKKVAPNTPFLSLVRGRNANSLEVMPDDVLEEYLVTNWQMGIDVFRNFNWANDVRDLKRSSDIILEKTDAKLQITLSFNEDRKLGEGIYSIDYYINKLHEYMDAGIFVPGNERFELCIKDMSGQGSPQFMRDLARAIRKEIGAETKMVYHAHATGGLDPIIGFIEGAAVPGAEEEKVVVDVVPETMAYYYSHYPTESTVTKVEKDPRFTTGIDLKVVQEESKALYPYAERRHLVNGWLPVNSQVLDDGIPGGARSNFQRLLLDNKEENLWPIIQSLYKHITRCAGDGHPVTPSSQYYFYAARAMAISIATELYRQENIVDFAAKGGGIKYSEAPRLWAEVEKEVTDTISTWREGTPDVDYRIRDIAKLIPGYEAGWKAVKTVKTFKSLINQELGRTPSEVPQTIADWVLGDGTKIDYDRPLAEKDPGMEKALKYVRDNGLYSTEKIKVRKKGGGFEYIEKGKLTALTYACWGKEGKDKDVMEVLQWMGGKGPRPEPNPDTTYNPTRDDDLEAMGLGSEIRRAKKLMEEFGIAEYTIRTALELTLVNPSKKKKDTKHIHVSDYIATHFPEALRKYQAWDFTHEFISNINPELGEFFVKSYLENKKLDGHHAENFTRDFLQQENLENLSVIINSNRIMRTVLGSAEEFNKYQGAIDEESQNADFDRTAVSRDYITEWQRTKIRDEYSKFIDYLKTEEGLKLIPEEEVLAGYIKHLSGIAEGLEQGGSIKDLLESEEDYYSQNIAVLKAYKKDEKAFTTLKTMRKTTVQEYAKETPIEILEREFEEYDQARAKGEYFSKGLSLNLEEQAETYTLLNMVREILHSDEQFREYVTSYLEQREQGTDIISFSREHLQAKDEEKLMKIFEQEIADYQRAIDSAQDYGASLFVAPQDLGIVVVKGDGVEVFITEEDGAPPYVEVEKEINPGDITHLEGIMKMYSEQHSEVEGKVLKVLFDPKDKEMPQGSVLMQTNAYEKTIFKYVEKKDEEAA
ncbi:hypothetical protein ACFL0W_02805 [Nanoarchaeota archaeon]